MFALTVENVVGLRLARDPPETGRVNAAGIARRKNHSEAMR
jgi:hypothetical protein